MYLYSALFVVPHTQGAQAWITQCYLQYYTNACLYLVSVHQMAPPQTEVAQSKKVKRSKVKEIIVLIKARSFLDELNLEHLTS